MKTPISSDAWKFVFMDVPALVTFCRTESFLLKFNVMLQEPKKKLQFQGNVLPRILAKLLRWQSDCGTMASS
jgi:hypothetical protein